jgi:hypothetical protein
MTGLGSVSVEDRNHSSNSILKRLKENEVLKIELSSGNFADHRHGI